MPRSLHTESGTGPYRVKAGWRGNLPGENRTDLTRTTCWATLDEANKQVSELLFGRYDGAKRINSIVLSFESTVLVAAELQEIHVNKKNGNALITVGGVTTIHTLDDLDGAQIPNSTYRFTTKIDRPKKIKPIKPIPTDLNLCEHPECSSQKVFGFEAGRSRFCGVHKEVKMVNLAASRCQKCCNKTPTFGFEGGLPTVCNDHKEPDMVSIDIRCNCGAVASYGFEGERFNCCRGCSKPGMIYLRVAQGNHCKHEDFCPVAPSYGFEGVTPRYCEAHKKEGMLNQNVWRFIRSREAAGFQVSRPILKPVTLAFAKKNS